MGKQRRHIRTSKKGKRFKAGKGKMIRVMMFNPQMDKIQTYTDMPSFIASSKKSGLLSPEWEWEGTDELLSLDDEGNVRDINPIIIQETKKNIGDLQIVPTDKGIRTNKYSTVLTKVTEPKYGKVTTEKSTVTPDYKLITHTLTTKPFWKVKND